MDYNTASGIITNYNTLRRRAYDICQDDTSLMGEDEWLWNALTKGDMLLDCNADGVRCYGLTYTNITMDNESFDFTIPYDRF